MSKSKSFIYQLPIKIERYQENILLKRFEAARQLYNACLGFSLKKRKHMVKNSLYKEAIEIYKKDKKKAKPIFKELAELYRFSEYEVHKYVTKIRNSQFSHLIDSNTAQKIASRAFKSVEEFHYKKRGKPRFKSFGQLKSVEGKSNKTGIRFIDGKLIWNKLTLDLYFDKKDTHGIEAHALNSPVKYCRIVAKKIRKKPRYFLQLILKGSPKIKEKDVVNKGIVGLDLGPQSIAVVSNNGSVLKIFAEDVLRTIKDKKKIQKSLARKLRINNPDNFENNFYIKKDKHVKKKLGKMKKDKKDWVFSKNYLREKERLAELERKNKEKRKESHNRLAKQLLLLGNEFKMEKISYKAWQKMFGKSIGAKSPGLFVEILKRKAENAGGSVYEFKTYTTALSQMCICGLKKKKTLSQRFHSCDCGILAQRDLFSAFLALFVDNDTLDLKKASKAFSGVEHGLVSAVLNLKDLNASDLKLLGIKYSEIENLVDKFQTKQLCQYN